VAKVLLDFMRRALVIKVDFLDRRYQEQLKQRSSQRLRPPWAIDEDERLEEASILFPRSRQQRDYRGNTFLSARGGFGQYLRRGPTFPGYEQRLSLEETQDLILDLLRVLRIGGLVEEVMQAEREDQVPGYQMPAAAMVWIAGDGSVAFHDPIRVPGFPEGGGRTNQFFIEFYQSIAAGLAGIEAKEHTAQVSNEERETREQRFRSADLPILFCSPTMELGIDIALLNVVNLRNVPPTPANYAQRSGRAGRSGQPALVFSYCSTGSSHDQYFFRQPELMVSGAVLPPRLDLANEDLIRAHVQAIWLAETGLDLGKSLRDVIDLSGDPPSLELLDRVRDSLLDAGAKRRGRARAEAVLETVVEYLPGSGWYNDRWVDTVFDQLLIRFEAACKRWRSLHRAAHKQRELQNRIAADHARPQQDRDQARALRREAESQLDLLADPANVIQSDFYSYRYFASEGFLPGYNFPRLPLSAYIPGRRLRGPRDEYLSRPRFLAISEFGPRAIIYHEGSRYIINKVILPVDQDDEEAPTAQAKQCGRCGYLHPIAQGDGPDLCESCGAGLDAPIRNLFRLQNVSTKRRDRINCDEEERVRMGFELRSGVRFSERGSGPSFETGDVQANGIRLAKLTYGHAASIWRINLGWRRRQNPNQLGFLLDMERGYWQRNEAADEEDPDDPMSPRLQRVVPYVEDHKNCLILEPVARLSVAAMASLQAAVKDAIQVIYQLEDSELAAEPLPDRDVRRSILFYEAAEGGAGVLRRLIEDPQALLKVARAALSICHFDPETGVDLRRAARAKEECEAACYDCLMSYSNQLDHPLLDRQEVREWLLSLRDASLALAPASTSRAQHLRQLKNLAGSGLEVQWLALLERGNCRLPSHAQRLFEECSTRPDFFYESAFAAIYVDGPHHEYPDRAARDEAQAACMQDLGYTVIRFGHIEEWQAVIDRYPGIFGGSE
jgi:very-short-patch-repair endonuclease